MDLNSVVLGGAQLGFDYGITNVDGKVPADVALNIADYFQKHGGCLIDTAPAYGNSEHVVALILEKFSKLDVITKTNPASSIGIVKSIKRSLEILKRESVYGFLSHNPESLVLNKEDINSLKKVRENGWAKKVGISCYDPELAEVIYKKFKYDLVQIPVNVFDQRFLNSKVLEMWVKDGVEIHSRSLFMQGILLQNSLSHGEKFFKYKKDFDRVHKAWADNSLKKTEGAFDFFKSLKGINKAVVGFHNLDQVVEARSAVASGHGSDIEYSKFALDDEFILNPAMWV